MFSNQIVAIISRNLIVYLQMKNKRIFIGFVSVYMATQSKMYQITYEYK